MNLTADQVLALAPDAASAAAGKKLGNLRSWQGLGQSAEALWGECQGSALYQVRVDLRDMGVRCSCPSRKFPCKHGLGLLLLAASTPTAIPQGTPPELVAEWMAKRASDAAKRESRPKTAEVDSEAQARRADRRLAQVAKGLQGLDLWMNDLMRNGLASLELQPATIWENQAARMVDAQAPGIAARLRTMGGIPNATPDWPERLLAELGRLALLTHAFRRIEALDAPLQEDVRQAIGWTVKEEEVIARGDALADEWIVLGQRVTGEDRLRTQRTWLLGSGTQRFALVLQFSAARAPFPATVLPGSRQEATLAYWPGAYPQRALIHERHGNPVPLRGRLPGVETFQEFLAGVTQALARQPWLDRFPCALRDAVPVREGDRWHLQDRAGMALPLVRGEHWRLLAWSGGAPVDLAGEWNGAALLPLGVMADGNYHLLWDGDL